MSGRVVPFAAGLTVFALLPFLGGSAPSSQRADVVLAAGAPAQAAVQDAVGVVEAARQGLSGQATSALLGDAVAVGGGNAAFSGAAGLFMFPSISLSPATAQAVAAPAMGPLGPFASAGFIHPVPGGEMSPFGPRIHPVLHRAMFHTGIDLQASCGTPIRAAADGTVIYARVSNSWGLRTIIQHTSGVKTAYGHQSKFLVKEGDVVKQGQVIGLVGTTGWSTGCHLHFDVIINDRYVDPAPYLGFPAAAVDSIPYAVVPHLVLDGSGRTVQTVQDGDVPIPPRGTAGSSSAIDGYGTSTPTSTPTTTRPTTSGTSSGTTTTRPPTSGSTGTSTSTGTGTSSGTGSSTGTPTSGTTSSSSSSTTTTQPPAQTTTTSSPATTTNPPQTTTSSTTAADPTPSDTTTTSTSQSTTSAEQSVTTSDPAPAASSDTTSKSVAPSDTTTSSAASSDSTSTADPTGSTAGATP
jgi:murein DD-endopeptidase MepM/ murein hydrolase activator NlpD